MPLLRCWPLSPCCRRGVGLSSTEPRCHFPQPPEPYLPHHFRWGHWGGKGWVTCLQSHTVHCRVVARVSSRLWFSSKHPCLSFRVLCPGPAWKLCLLPLDLQGHLLSMFQWAPSAAELKAGWQFDSVKVWPGPFSVQLSLLQWVYLHPQWPDTVNSGLISNACTGHNLPCCPAELRCCECVQAIGGVVQVA